MSEIDLQRQIDALRKRLNTLATIEQPAIACRVYNDAAFTHNSTGNYLAITFNTDRSDPYGLHSTTSNTSRITVTLAGWYLISGHATFAANATGIRQLAIRADGSTYIAAQNQTALSDVVVHLSLATVYYLAATNYIELMAYQNSGGNLDVQAAGNYSPEFAVMRLA